MGLNTVKIAWDSQDRPEITVTYGHEDEPGPAADSEESLGALAANLTDKSASFLSKLLELNEERGAVSLAELADVLGVEKKEADGWNRNFGRSVKVVVRDFGFIRPDQEDGTAQVFDFEWDEDGSQWRYIVPSAFRSTLTQALDRR